MTETPIDTNTPQFREYESLVTEAVVEVATTEIAKEQLQAIAGIDPSQYLMATALVLMKGAYASLKALGLELDDIIAIVRGLEVAERAQQTTKFLEILEALEQRAISHERLPEHHANLADEARHLLKALIPSEPQLTRAFIIVGLLEQAMLHSLPLPRPARELAYELCSIVQAEVYPT